MTVDGCWKIAIFNQNSNLYTSETDKNLKKKVYGLKEARTRDLEGAKLKLYHWANPSARRERDFINQYHS